MGRKVSKQYCIMFSYKNMSMWEKGDGIKKNFLKKKTEQLTTSSNDMPFLV
jgi:hypothetical protein